MMSKPTPTIVTIGKATQDVFLTSSKSFEPYKHKGVLYEQLPLGAKLDLDEVIFSTGGNVTNAAVTFVRQGLHCRYLWILGNDMASRAIIEELDREGVDTRGIVQGDGYRASYSTVLLAPGGERTILNYHGSMLASDGHPLDLQPIAAADWLYLSALGDMALLEKIISLAASAGTKIMLNPAGSELKEMSKLKALLGDIEVLAVNKEEAGMIVAGKTLEELARHGTHYCPVVIVSDGPNGVVATDSKTITRAGMYEDVPVVDRTGAGDAFGSGFLSKWVLGKPLEECIIFASANSTAVVTKIGAKAGILSHGARLHHMPIHSKPF